MGTIVEVPLSNGFYVSDSLPSSNQKCINFIPIIPEIPSLSKLNLIGTQGITQITTSGTDSTEANRGSHVMGGLAYVVNGTYLYKLEKTLVSGVETFNLISLGFIESGGRVSMADNGTQLMILNPGSKGYIYTISGGLVEITDLDFSASGAPQYVVFIDGYFACSTDSKKWVVSSINDGTAWNALDFGTAESDPDDVVAPVVHSNQIFMAGGETTEAFQNIGGSGFPFQRSNIFLDKGCFAPFTLKSTNDRFFMIGGGENESPAVWSYQGGRFTRVSNIAIDNILSSVTQSELQASFSLSWAIKGQYYISFTVGERTFVYNMTTQLWHEQKSSILSSGDYIQVRWRVNSLITAYGYTIVCDSQDGRVGILSDEVYTEYGTNIIRIFSTQPLARKGKSFRIPSIELTVESGVGNEAQPDPVISMSISENGKTFSYERSRKIGKAGEYKKRVIWRKNGRLPRFGILEFRFTDPVKPRIIKLELEIS